MSPFWRAGLHVADAGWKMRWLGRVAALEDSHSETPNPLVKRKLRCARSPSAFAFSAPAVAQSWKEYSYPEYAISVAFPTSPRIETTTYQMADGRSVPARVYSVHKDKGEFKLTVADLANTGLNEKAVIDHAIVALSQGGTVKVNIPARIYQVYGRQLTIERADGSRSMVALFDFMGRLYQIEAKVPPDGNQFELIRFQQSLVFERGVSNRSPEEIRAIREACPCLAGILNAAGNPVTPAGADDPRCQAQR
jgi:hypothetical protein